MQPCEHYDLWVETTLGESFCLVDRNSTGEGAFITASGSTAVGEGALTLDVSAVPANQFGLLAFGPGAAGLTPLGGGWLCLTGSIVRLPVTSTTAAGSMSTTIDWSAPGAAGVIAPGEDWYFQGWYRDPLAAGVAFNLTEGLRLSFE